MTQEAVAFWSGHANSSAMCLRMVEIGQAPDLIVHAVTGLEFPEVYDFMDKFEKLIGVQVIRENVIAKKPNYEFDKYFNQPFCRGKFVGSIHGFPMMAGRCWHKANVKNPVYRKYERNARETYTGMTVDEVHRISMNPKYKYPLIDWRWDAKFCLHFLKTRDIPHPIYDRGFKRLGCVFCPNQSKEDLFIIYRDYPKIWDKLLDYESKSPRKMRGNGTGNKDLFQLQDVFEKRLKQKVLFVNEREQAGEQQESTAAKEE